MSAKSPVLGIDFGTTNTAAAWFDRNNQLHLVPVREGVYTLPSVVCYHDRGGILVGEAAKQGIEQQPTSTIYSIKRFLGRRFMSDLVGRHRDRFAFHLVEGNDGLTAVNVAGEVRPLADTALEIVKRIVELANIAAGEPFEQCVVATPAHFSQRQRHLLRQVVEQAGLQVKIMVNEPTAAALYYAKDQKSEETVLVYDLGGGTFDTSLLRLRSGIVDVLATGGDTFLGGNDFDGAIVNSLLERFEHDHDICLRDDRIVMQRLSFAAEMAKIHLSNVVQTEIRVPCIAQRGDKFLDFNYTLTRGQLERICAPLIERTMGICLDVLKEAGLKSTNIDEVLLIGGQTKMPSIRTRLSTIFKFGKPGAVDPDMGVAVGAATYGFGKQILSDVLSIPVGVMFPGSSPEPALEKNVSLPCARRVPIRQRPQPGQPLPIVVFEALDATSIDRDVLGTMRVNADWLEAHPGDLNLKVGMSGNFQLSFAICGEDGDTEKLQMSYGTQTTPQKKAEPVRPEPPQPERVTRGEPRLAVEAKVAVRQRGQKEFFQLVSHNLSKTGLFIVANHPLPRGSEVEILLDTAGGPAMFLGRVMHAVDQASAQQAQQHPGMGIRFENLSPGQDQVLTAHLSTLNGAPTVGGDLDEVEITVDEESDEFEIEVEIETEEEDPVAVLRRFVTAVKKNELYTALDIHPLTSSEDVKLCIKATKKMFKAMLPHARPALAQTINAADQVLTRTANLLLNPRRRLAYDFQQGFIFADKRLEAAAQGGPDTNLLREAWKRARPKDVDQAGMHIAHALKAAQEKDLQGALNEGRRAQQLDPFDSDLRRLVHTWTNFGK